MKFLVLAIIVFLAACTPTKQDEFNKLTRVSSLTGSAFQYLNFSEATHRYELKDFIGVDPVKTEWCAAFVNAVLSETGLPSSDTVSEYPLTAKSFLHWGYSVPANEVQLGDIVIFPRGNESWQGHVGFYLRTIEKDGVPHYAILGGNQKNMVSIEFYNANRAISIRRYPS